MNNTEKIQHAGGDSCSQQLQLSKVFSQAVKSLILVIIITQSVSCQSGHVGAEAGASGAGDSNYPSFGNGGYQVEHYDLEIEVTNVFRSEILGQTTIHAISTQTLGSFNLDFLGFEIKDLIVNGRSADYSRSGQELTVVPEKVIGENEAFTVFVSYEGSPRQYTSRTLPVRVGWVNFFHGSYVINFIDGAATFFPVNDTPLDKATYTFLVKVPDPYEVVANGVLAQVTKEAGTTSYLWEAFDSMASYLTTVNVGQFDLVNQEGPNGLPISLYYPEKAEDVLVPFLRQPEMLHYFSDIFGPYPFQSYGAVVLDTNLAIAMESQTMSVFSKSFIDELTVAHEIAHQWFGNSLTVADTKDIWLHEGFATYAEALWLEHSEGVVSRDELIEEFFAKVRFAKDPYFPPGNPPANKLFNGGVYYWASITLHLLREKIGDEAFFQSLQDFYEQFRGRNVRTEDFIEICERNSGLSLDYFFSTWLYSDTMPIVSKFEPCVVGEPEFKSDGPVYPAGGNGVSYSEWFGLEIDPSICREEDPEGDINLTCIGAANFSGPLDEVMYMFAVNGVELTEEVEPGYYRVQTNCNPGEGVFQQLSENIFMVNLFSLRCECKVTVRIDENIFISSNLVFKTE